MDQILEILKDIHPEHDFFSSVDFVTDGLLDSLDIVTIVTELEERFGILVDGEDVTPENFMNLKSLDRLLAKCLHNHASSI